MVTEQQMQIFQNRGILFLPKLLDPVKVRLASLAILSRAEKNGLWKNDSWQLSNRPDTPVPEAVSKLLGRTNTEDSLGDLCEGIVESIILQLLGGCTYHSPIRNGQILFTLPKADNWNVPYANWHLDIARLPDMGLPGVQFFTFLNQVKPGGGGTLVVAGSHLLLNGNEMIKSKNVRGRLKKWDYFKKLMQPGTSDRLEFLSNPGEVEGHQMQVVEMHGNPADVYLMDMRLIHTISPNTAKVPRIMMTKRYFLKDAYDQVYQD